MSELLFIDDEITEIDQNLVNNTNHVINFSSIDLKSKKIINETKRYNDIRYRIKNKYSAFIYNLGNEKIKDKSIKQHFKVDGYSLWWFSEIQHKDTFFDSFFDDLCKAVLLKSFENDYKIVLISKSPLLLYLFEGKKRSTFIILSKLAVRRAKQFFLLSINKILLQIIPIKTSGPFHDITAFFCHDVNIQIENNGKYHDRIFGNIPNEVHNGRLLIKLTKLYFQIPPFIKNQIIIDRYYSLVQLVITFFNFRHFIKYIRIRKEFLNHCYIDGIDIKPIFDQYMWETILWNDFYYVSLVKVLKKINNRINIIKYVNYGEFGLPVRSLVIAANAKKREVIWMQHGIVLPWELNFVYCPSEIVDKYYNINTNFIEYLPVGDKYIVWGDWLHDILIKSGYPKQKIFIGGSYFHDQLKQVRERNSIYNNKESKIILICPSVAFQEILLFSHYALSIKAKFKEYEVILKLHPRKINSTQVSKKLKMCFDNGIKVETKAISNYYNSANIVIVGASTIGIEFSYLKKDLIVYSNEYNNRYTPPWVQHDYSIKNNQELFSQIDHYNKKKIPYNYYIGEPGNSKNKIIEIINAK